MPGVRGVRGRRHVKRYHYDFHIHSCLSPCGDDEMTPADIVGMACVNGLDIIALTDHNCARNTPAAVRAGERAGLTVIPGMELETAEEVHVVLLFPTAEAALACGQVVDDARFKIGNRPDIYGRQVIMDESDNECGEVADLLVTSTSIGVYEAAALAGSAASRIRRTRTSRPTAYCRFSARSTAIWALRPSRRAPAPTRRLSAGWLRTGMRSCTARTRIIWPTSARPTTATESNLTRRRRRPSYGIYANKHSDIQ